MKHSLGTTMFVLASAHTASVLHSSDEDLGELLRQWSRDQRPAPTPESSPGGGGGGFHPPSP